MEDDACAGDENGKGGQATRNKDRHKKERDSIHQQKC